MKKVYLLILALAITVLIAFYQQKSMLQQQEIYEEPTQERQELELIFEEEVEQNISESPQNITQAEEPIIQTSKTCSEPIKLSHPPVNLEKTLYILPLGGLAGEHVAPIDHQYYQNFNNKEANIEVYAPADGVITDMQHMGSFVGDDENMEPFDDYRLVIEHTCSISTIYIHIDKLSEKVQAVAPEFGTYNRVDLPVKAGEVIGWYKDNVDFNVVDKDYTIDFINPESYISDHNRKHIQDPFIYYEDPIKTQLIEKSLRTAEPIGGILDYDIKGKLVGTWFKENTNGWAGLEQQRYWADHLAIVPHNIDPDHILFSIGTYEGRAKQFGVKNNEPNPAEVDSTTGLIKYELVDYSIYDGNNPWDFKSFSQNLKLKNHNQVHGVVLLQMLNDTKLKLEVFPNEKASEINAFTDNADIYER